jgi:hypothetical protein
MHWMRIRWEKGEREMTAIENSKPKIQFETKRILVTPRLAKETLECNTNNRTLTQVRVDEFVSLMKAGRFQCTHQGIALDSAGAIVDGQHRLAAVVKSGCSVYMLVSKGVPEETRLAVDTGKARSALAISKLIGRPSDSTAKYAIARILKYGPVKSSQMHVPTETLFDLVDAFSEGIDFVLPMGAGVSASILAVVARAAYTKDKRRLRQFVDVYKTARSENEGDTSAIKLKLLMSTKQSPHDGGTIYTNYRQYVYQMAESAVSDFLNKYPTRVLKASRIEKFPIPQDLNGWN